MTFIERITIVPDMVAIAAPCIVPQRGVMLPDIESEGLSDPLGAGGHRGMELYGSTSVAWRTRPCVLQNRQRFDLEMRGPDPLPSRRPDESLLARVPVWHLPFHPHKRID